MTKLYELEGKRVWVAGHTGMVGSALLRRLGKRAKVELLTVTRRDLDLRDQTATRAWLSEVRPDAVFLSAATVGGILANDTRPAEFLYDNLMIASNIIDACHRTGVEKLLYLGSSCIYPRLADQPIDEDQLLTGPLEPTNEWYAVAKIAGIKLCQAYRRQYGADFISAMPTNLYGPGDNFDLHSSHVVPALLRKAVEAKAAGQSDLPIWGSGRPRREFMYVDDCAAALVHIMENYSGEDFLNVGTGEDLTILELAQTIMRIVGLDGTVACDPTRPDGSPRKLLAVDRLRALGWHASTDIETGLRQTFEWYTATRA